MLKLHAFVLPLGLDTFAVAAAIGASQVTTVRQRLRISLIFVIFEGGMPLIGLGLAAEYLAGAAVAGWSADGAKSTPYCHSGDLPGGRIPAYS